MPNNFFLNIILMATLAYRMIVLHFIYHIGYFRYWDDDRDSSGNDFQFLGTKVGVSKKLGTKI